MSMEPSEEQVIQAVYKRAAALVKAGKSKEEVKMDLKSQGLDDLLLGRFHAHCCASFILPNYE